jgi:3D (Asp-Asp-Asp) domain-containing protein
VVEEKMAEPKGKLVGYGFNRAPPVNAYTDFYIEVHNQGDAEGQVFAILRNKAGNPASVKVMWQGTEWTVAPGSPIALRPGATVAPCSNFRAEANIKYEVEGEYKLDVEVWHKDRYGLDAFDEAETVSVAVAAPTIETSLTIEAPGRIMKGQAFTVSGVLTRKDTGTGISNQKIDIYYNRTKIGEGFTDANGRYEASVSIPASGSFTLKAEFPGTSTFQASTVSTTTHVGIIVGPFKLWTFPLLNMLLGRRLVF